MKKVFLSFLLTISNLAVSGTLDAIKERGFIRVATFENNLPFSQKSAKGNKGVDIEIAKAIAKAIFDDGNKIEFIFTTNGDRIPNLKSDSVDLVVGNFSINKLRRKAVDFAEPYVKSNLSVITHKSKVIRTLDGVKLGTTKNSLAVEYIKKSDPNIGLVEFRDSITALEALEKNEIDGYINDTLLVHRQLKKNPDYVVSLSMGDYLYSAPAVKKGNKELLHVVNEEMKKLKADGRLEAWYKMYMEPLYDESLKAAQVLAL